MARAKKTRRPPLVPIGLGLAALLVFSTPIWGPALGRQTDWFDVEQIEVSGASLLPPHEVLRLSGIEEGQSILDDRRVWEIALEQHPAIATARLQRKLPHTLRLRIEEERPVALIGVDTLSLATADGTVLPVDPADVALDLPIVIGTLDPDTRAATRRALAEVGRLETVDPVFARQVAEIHPLDAGGTTLRLVHAEGDILLPIGEPQLRIEQLRAVLADVASRRGSQEENSAVRAEIDLRFEGQIVVRLPNQPGFS